MLITGVPGTRRFSVGLAIKLFLAFLAADDFLGLGGGDVPGSSRLFAVLFFLEEI
jgi:hypothetical protein